MRVMLSVPSIDSSYGGPARSVTQLASELASCGAQVGLATSLPDSSSHSLVPPTPDVPVINLRTRPGDILMRRVSRAIDSHAARVGAAQIIHDNGIWSLFNAKVASYALRNGIPLICSPRGMLEPWALAHHGTRKRIAWLTYQRSILKQASAFHATSQEEACAIRALGFAQPILVAPIGVYAPPPRSQARESLADPRYRVMLFMSRIHEKKGLMPLLEAWNRVRPRGWQLKIAGYDDGLAPLLMSRMENLRLGDSVVYLGPVEGQRKEDLLTEAEVFVLPSFSENFGIVVPEALMRGCPVIATRGTPWEAVAKVGCGWWVAATSNELASAIELATSRTPAELSGMGAIGRSWVELEFSWPSIAARTLTFYEWLLGAGARPEGVV